MKIKIPASFNNLTLQLNGSFQKLIKYFFRIVISFLLINSFSFSQNTRYETFRVSNTGLSNGNVNGIALDIYGRKWIATNNGLTVMDGNKWDVYNTDNSLLPDNKVKSILIDNGNNIWIGTDTRGIIIIRNGTWEIMNTQNSNLPSDYVRCIKDNYNGDIWVVFQSGALAKFDGVNWEYFTISDFNNDNAMDIAFDKDGKIWVSTYNGISDYSDSCWNSIHKDSLWSTSIAVDNNGNKWIGTSFRGLYEYKDSAWINFTPDNSGLTNNYVTTLQIDSSNRLWIGTYQGGLIIFDGINWSRIDSTNILPSTCYIGLIKFGNHGDVWISDHNWEPNGGNLRFKEGNYWYQYTSESTGLPDNVIKDVAVDKNNKKWICTLSGLTTFDDSLWFNLSNTGLSYIRPNKIYIDRNNIKWVGFGLSDLSNSNGLAKYNDTSWTYYNSSNSGLPTNYVVAMDMDSSGALWIGCDSVFAGRVAEFYNGTWKTFNLPSAVDFISDLKVDKKNNIWVSTNCGLYVYDGVSWTNFSSLPAKDTRSIAVDSKGNIWVGFYGNGIAEYDGNSSKIFNKYNSSIPDQDILSITIDKNDKLWITAASCKLFTFEGNVWQKYDNPQINNYSLPKLAIDKNNKKWLCSNSGLISLEGEIITSISLQRTAIKDYILFQNYPNPFNPTTTIRYQIPKEGFVTLKIFDMLGNEISTLINTEKPAGEYKVVFDATGLASGIYFYQLKVGEFLLTKKLLLLK